MLLGTLGTSLLRNMQPGKDVLRAGEGTKCRVGFLMLLHPLTNFEIQKYCQNELKFNGTLSGINLPKRGWGLS